MVHHVAVTIDGKSLVLMPKPGDQGLEIAAGYPPEDRLNDRSTAAAEWAWLHGQPAGLGSTTLPAADWLFLPMSTARGPVGVLGVQMPKQDEPPSPEQTRLLETLAEQAAAAIERTTLVSDIEAARVAAERERLRSTLLSSLSHDLRTPLASIIGAASSLLDYEQALDPHARREMAQTIQDEAERLNRFVQNLLDMTRISAGALKPNVDWADLPDIVASAVERARRLARHHRIRVDIDPELPLLRADAVLLEQMFFNLLDNACKYAPAGSTVTVWARRMPTVVAIEVCDQGPAFPRRIVRRCSICSIARRPAMLTAPAPVSVWLSAAASSRRTAEPSASTRACTAPVPASSCASRCPLISDRGCRLKVLRRADSGVRSHRAGAAIQILLTLRSMPAVVSA